ncbi:putative arylsulfatase regulatory protein [Candidatus Burkholderia verschuerenii]|uniref:Putative arylsulfatase regulatory protein n=1 Tax=Candidatus Burkholderia verschuerenii TaxID=242163 RepID=A0A0L0MGF3_9BURK|nr:anaerobic sulfatase maturase [Candidatus Burkholderia verschuerenii]KND61370.1 putative arylsulfatase regulatory protein [Candidatus Burkholderia verschuerenii]
MSANAGFHAMAKPSGPDCNLDCAYCFYLEKAALYRDEARHRMSDDTLDAYVRQYIEATPADHEVVFTWQGGEPTLLGLEFYERAVRLQQRHGAGRRIANSFQTNGLLIDETWCAFFKEHDFLIGLSLDGPAEIHDEYRVTVGGRPSHALVMRALRLFQSHGVRYNVLACVNRRSAQAPLEVYRFLRDNGVEYVQFIPVVERLPASRERGIGLTLRAPDGKVLAAAAPAIDGEVTEWSVRPEDYGTFLSAIVDELVRHDVGTMHVMNIEWALANFMGRPGASCHHQPTCGKAVVVEHNGDVYACDHYVYPDYRLGNLGTDDLTSMMALPQQTRFGQDKFDTLPAQCRRCSMLKGCWGGCPKHRFAMSEDGEAGLNSCAKATFISSVTACRG